MPFCPQCGADNPASARFCDQCGAALIPVPGPSSQSGAATVVPGASPASAPVVTAPAAAPTPAGAPSAGPNTCPQCGMAVIPGEAFCDNCGAPLIPTGAPAPAFGGAAVPQQPTYPPPQQIQSQPPAPAYTPPAPAYTPPTPAYTPAAAPVAPSRTSLAPAQLLSPSGATIPLPATSQATIGRADAVSGFFPDIDLTPHGALDNGVGRRHLRLFVQGSQLMVEDLDSTNGSFVNGQKLAPRQPQALNNGDELRLGRLNLRVQL